MADNSIIFGAVRPWLDARGFNDATRVAALNGACATFLVTHDKAAIFNVVRPWLDRQGFNTKGRVEDLNGACDRFLASAAASASGGGWWDNVPPPVTTLPPAGNDRWLPLFRRMASPAAAPDTVKAIARTFAAKAPEYGQDKTRERIAEFVAQCANESGGFTRFDESLKYSARRLTQVWPGRFPTLASAQPYAWDPSDPDREDIALANFTYGRRMGNERNGTADDDGWTYRGRGMLQLTGFDNYKFYGDRLGLDLVNHPELAADPVDSTIIALEFFRVGNVNAAIDAGNFREARHRTNGGYIGVDEVARLRRQALAVLS